MADIIASVLAARREIPNIVADETATISGQKGSFKFKYATLQGILEVVIPILAKHGVLLIQKVAGENRILEVETLLLCGGDSPITSGKIRVEYDGTTRDMAGKATSTKRVQLVSLLGLAVVDDDDATTATTTPNRTPPPTTPNRAATPPPATSGVVPGLPENFVRAAQAGREQDQGRSPGLQTLMLRIQQTEANDKGGLTMPTVPAEGKATSMYHYLADMVSEQTLCYLYGRVIDTSRPPLLSTKFFLDEVMAGTHDDVLAEAYVKAR